MDINANFPQCVDNIEPVNHVIPNEQDPDVAYCHILLHESKLITEMFILNLFLAFICFILDLHYEFALPFLCVMLIRSRFYDESMLPDPLPIPYQFFRLFLELLAIGILVELLDAHDVTPIPTGKSQRIRNYGFNHNTFEMTFCATIFSLAAIIFRFWYILGIVGGNVIEIFRSNSRPGSGSVGELEYPFLAI